MKEELNELDFGKDHWSLLAYIETLIVDSGISMGKIDNRKMRCNPNTHPHLLSSAHSGEWKPTYGTRISAVRYDDGENKERILFDHDDWDCLEDLEREGFIEWTPFEGIVKLTEKGIKTTNKIREHKVNGGTFSTFHISELIE